MARKSKHSHAIKHYVPIYGVGERTLESLSAEGVDLDDAHAVGNAIATRRGGGGRIDHEAKDPKPLPDDGKELFTLEDKMHESDIKPSLTDERRVIDLLIAAGVLSRADYLKAGDIVENLEAEWARRDHAFYFEKSGDRSCPGVELMKITSLKELAKRLGVRPKDLASYYN